MPFGLYFTWDEENQQTEMAAAIPVSQPTTLAPFESFEVKEQKALLIDFYGPYEKLGDAHHAMDAHIRANNLKTCIALEQYDTDPGQEPDSSKWLTKIYYTLLD